MLKKISESQLKEAKLARKKMDKKPTRLLKGTNICDVGVYLENYANCLVNRQIDIYDDSIFLLENNRIASACAISRGMIETYAISRLLFNKIADILEKHSDKEKIEKSEEIILKFTNSSRIKENEQNKVKKGKIKLEDYHFTEEAKYRMLNELGSSEHVMNALRALYKEELKSTNKELSSHEVVYDILSEWVHPSQTSIFHNYVKETHLTPCSLGNIDLNTSAIAVCSQALHFITDTMNVYNMTIKLAEILSDLYKKNIYNDSAVSITSDIFCNYNK